jgi:hypothetical protein
VSAEEYESMDEKLGDHFDRVRGLLDAETGE